MSALARPDHDRDRDEGSVLILCLVLILIAGFFVVPMMSYASTILRSQSLVQTKSTRAEAVEGGLRVALQDTTSLYEVCSGGPTQVRTLAAPPSAPGLPGLTSRCTSISTGATNVPGDQRFALTTTQLQSELVIPAPEPDDTYSTETNGTINATWCTSKADSPPTPCGKPFPYNGLVVTPADTANAIPAVYDATGTIWHTDPLTSLPWFTRESTNDQVFLPWLPVPDSDTQPAAGYWMPSWAGACRVFFPGTYIDDVVLSGSTPIYFVSGVYHFEKMLKITGGANVVVGTGANEGCVTSDNIAALEAVVDTATNTYPNKKQLDGSTGVGGKFVFGKLGRLVIDNSTGGDISFVMNRRLQQTGKPEAIMNDVSIISVDGVTAGATTGPYHRETVPGTVELDVPAGQVFSLSGINEPVSHGYSSSQLISEAAAPATCSTTAVTGPSACPIVDVNLSTAANVRVSIPGYVSVPMGSVLVTTSDPTNKVVSFGGGVLAAQAVVGTPPASLQIGLVQAVVQQTFKIVTETVSGTPALRGTAIVQVNQTGGYAINSYTIEQI